MLRMIELILIKIFNKNLLKTKKEFKFELKNGEYNLKKNFLTCMRVKNNFKIISSISKTNIVLSPLWSK
jgi:hypothetical protein